MDGPITPEEVRPKESSTGIAEVDAMVSAIKANSTIDSARKAHAAFDIQLFVRSLQTGILNKPRDLMNANPGITLEQAREIAVDHYLQEPGANRLDILRQYQYSPVNRDGRTSVNEPPANPQNEIFQIHSLLQSLGMLPDGCETVPVFQNWINNQQRLESEATEDHMKALDEIRQNGNPSIAYNKEAGFVSVVGLTRKTSEGLPVAHASFSVKYDGKNGLPVARNYGIELEFHPEIMRKIASSPKNQSLDSLQAPKVFNHTGGAV